MAKRAWIDTSQYEISPPELGPDNLPVPLKRNTEPIPLYGKKPSTYYVDDSRYSEGSGKYLIGAPRGIYDEEHTKSLEQGTINKYASGLASRGLSVIPKTLQGIGHVGGAIAYGADYMFDPDNADPNIIWDNAFSNLMSDIDEGLREAMPIYKTYAGRTGSLLQQMKDPGFWADDFFDSLAFLASAYITGSTAGAATKGLFFSKAAMEAGKGAKAFATTRNIVATSLQTISESGFEAKEFMDSNRIKESLNKFGRTYEYLDDKQKEEIDTELSLGASNVFRGNMGVLLIPNYIQSRFLFGTGGMEASKLRHLVRSGQLSSSEVNAFKGALKSIGTGVISEGLWEEGMQNALQTYNERRDDFGLKFDEYLLNVVDEWVSNFNTTEGQKNMVLGSLVGGLFGGFGGISQARKDKGRIEALELEYELLKAQLGTYDKWYGEYIKDPYKTFKTKVQEEQEDGTTIEKEVDTYFDKDGKLSFDNDKMQRMFLYTLYNKFLFDEAMVATINGDNIHADVVNKDAIGRLYYHYASDPDITSLDEVESLLLERDLGLPEELAKEGYTNKFTKADLAPYRKAFEEARSKFMDVKDFDGDNTRQQFKNVARKTIYAEQLKRDLYGDMLRRDDMGDKAKEDIRRLIEDSNKMTQMLLNKETFEKLYNDFVQESQAREALESKLKNAKDSKKQSDIDRAMYDVNENKYIEGADPYSTAFAQRLQEGKLTSTELGARYKYFYDLGDAAKRKAQVTRNIELAKKGKIPISDIVSAVATDIIEGMEYSKDEIDQVKELMGERKRNLERRERELPERKKRIEDNSPEIEIMEPDGEGIPLLKKIPNPNYNARQAELDQQWLADYTQKKIDSERAGMAWDEFSKDMPEFPSRSMMKDKRRNYRHFQREYGSRSIQQAKNLRMSYDGNPDVFDQSTDIAEAIKNLEDTKRIYGMPGRKKLLTTREFKGFMEEVDQAIGSLREIKEKVDYNAESRKANDRRTAINYANSFYNAIGITVDRAKHEWSVVNQKLFDVIADVIGIDNLTGILDSAKNAVEGETDFSFDMIFVEKIIHEANQVKDGIKKIDNVLKELEKGYKNEFAEAVINTSTMKEGIASVALTTELPAYKKNPFRVFDNLLSIIIRRDDNPANRTNAIDKFLRTKDAFELYEKIKSGADIVYDTITREELLALLDAHIKILGISKLRIRLNSKAKINEIIGIESQVKKDHAPSNQQLIALREALYELQHSVDNTAPFNGMFYLKGVAGSGKTQLICKYLPDLLNVDADGVIALSTQENALEVLKKSLEGISNTGLVNSLTLEQLQNEKIKVVIVDEVARMTNNELRSLAEKLVEANKKRQSPLQAFVLGDPTQVISATDRWPAIGDYYDEKINIRELSPLTAVFRSGNNAIIRAQNVFLDFPAKVKTFLGTADAEIGNPAIGVHVSNEGMDLVEQLKVHQNANKRTRVVVVSNESQLKEYRKHHDNVMMYNEVAGLEFDEVYLDIRPEDFAKFDKHATRKFNEAMYTAMSRSISYTFVRSYEAPGNWKYEVGQVKVEDTKERNEQLKADYATRLTFEANVLGKAMDGVKFKSPQIIEPVEGTEEKISSPQNEAEPNIEDVKSIENIPDDGKVFEEESDEKGITNLKYPSYHAIHPEGYKDSSFKPPVRTGSRVKYLLIRDEKGEDQIQVVAEHLNIDDTPLDNPIYEEIAILSEEEIIADTFLAKKLREGIKKAIENGKPVRGGLTQGKKGALKKASPKTVLAEGVIRKAVPLNYRYNKQGKIVSQGIGFLSDLMRKMQVMFSDPSAEKLDFRVQIFSIKEAQESDLNVIAGVPYLVAERKTRTKEGVETASNSQFVWLTGRRMRSDDTAMVALREYVDTIKQIESIAGVGSFASAEFKAFLKRFKRNYHVENEEIKTKEKDGYSYQDFLDDVKKYNYKELTEQQFNQIAELSDKIIKGYYGIGDVRKEVKNEQEMWDYLGEEAKLDTESEYQFKAHKKDVEGGLILKTNKKNKDLASYVTTRDLEAGKGPVQIWLNVISRANKNSPFAVTHKLDKHIGKKRYIQYVTKAKALLAEETSSEYYKHLLAIYHEAQNVLKASGVDMKGYQQWIDKDSKMLNDEENLARIEEILLKLVEEEGEKIEGVSRENFRQLREKYTKDPFTVESLEGILSFNERGENENLYLPLMMGGKRGINELGKDLANNRGALEELLGTKLEEINKTQIQIELDEKAPEVPFEKKQTKVEKKISEVKDNVKNIIEKRNKRNKRLMSETNKSLGKKITFDEAHKLLKKFLPNADSDVIRFLDKVLLDELAGEKAHGLYQNEVIYAMKRGEKTFTNIIRHEAFHKIFNEYLTKEEQKGILNAFKKQFPQYKNKSIIEIEELLAEKFQDYQTKKLTGINKVLTDFFNWLSKVFGFYNLNVNNITRFFETIESGYFTQSVHSAQGVKRSMRDIVRRFGNGNNRYSQSLSIYKQSRILIEDLFSDLTNEGYEVEEDDGLYPVTRKEVKQIAKRIIESDLRELLSQAKEAKDNPYEGSEGDLIEINEEINIHKKVLENYNDIINDIYPNLKFKDRGEIRTEESLDQESIEESLQEDAEENTGRSSIREHIVNSDEVDQERKSSEAVKDFLSNVSIGDKYMNWREAYIRTLQLFQGLQISSSNFIDQLKRQVIENGNSPRSTVIVNHIIDLMSKAQVTTYGEQGFVFSDNMKFITENTFLLDPNDTDISSYHGETEAEVDGLTIIHRRPGESTRNFIKRIAEGNKLNKEEVIALFNKYSAKDQLKAIVAHFNNQKEKNIHFVEKRTVQGGIYSIQYVMSATEGQHKNIRSIIQASLAEKFPGIEDLNGWIESWLAKHKESGKKNPLKFIKEFLYEIGLSNYASDIPDSRLTKNYNDIIKFFERAKDQLGKTVKVEQDGEMKEYIVTMMDIMDSDAKMVNGLSKLLSASTSNMRATSSRDFANKKKYLWSPASYLHNIIYNLINNKGLSGNIKFDLPAYLNKPYFAFNSFIKKLNTIHQIVDHDGIRSIDWNGFVTGKEFKKETTQEFIMRSFVAGFIDRIRYSVEGKETYIQSFSPNDRPGLIGAEVNVLSMEQARVAIKDMINQWISSEQLQGIDVNTKDRFVNFRLLENALGKRDLTKNPFTEKDIDNYTDKIFEELTKLRDRFVDKVIKNRVPFDVETSSIKGLKHLFGEKFVTGEKQGKEITRTFKTEGGVSSYAITKEMINDIAMLYTVNHYVNSYFLNQLVLGDYNQFKNEEDVVKRFNLATAPGFRPVVNPVFGIKERSKFVVLDDYFKSTDDIKVRIESLLQTKEEKELLDLLVEKFKESFAAGDGQGFMLPERFEELKYGGFNSEFSIHKVLKPVVYSVNQDGVVRALKFSSIVLTDELTTDFPSLGILRDNLRRSGAGEAIFASGVKVGMPQALASPENMTRGDYPIQDNMTLEVNNDHYRIQLDPISKVDSEVTQPSQLMYLARVLQHNKDVSQSIYDHFREVTKIGSEKFFIKFGNAAGIKTNILDIIKKNSNERIYEMLANGLSIDFPAISNNIVIQLASHLSDNIVRFPFKGTKLVLQSEYGVRKYNKSALDGYQNKLKFIRSKDVNGVSRLVAEVIIPEGILEAEHEQMIKDAIAQGKDAADFYDLPDIMGFRIPSSDIHSGIVMKVVGFYPTSDVNVIIAPDLLVALHGSDFDVDSLFIVKREKDSEGNIAGYKKAKGKLVYDSKREYEDIEDQLSFHKNGIVNDLIDLLSHPENLKHMLAPIPMTPINKQKERVLKDRKEKESIDLNDINTHIEYHKVIFGASSATGILNNAAKALAFSMRIGKDGENPKLRNPEDGITIGKNVYDGIRLFDDTGENLFVSLDGFINAAIDNIKLLTLNSLNITKDTINGFIALRALGVPLNVCIDILQQPAIKDYIETGNMNSAEAIVKEVIGRSEFNVDEVTLDEKTLKNNINIMSVRDMTPAINENGEVDLKAFNALLFQLKVLKEFNKMNKVGNKIGDLARWLILARTFPVSKVEIDDMVIRAKEIFGTVEEDGTLSDYEETSDYPFDITNIFKDNPHLLELYKNLIKFQNTISEGIKKYNKKIDGFVDNIFKMMGKFGEKEAVSKEFIRNEFLSYLLSNEIYSGEYKINQNAQYKYIKNKEERILTGPKAINQIFIGKVDALSKYLSDRKDSQGQVKRNMFLDHLYTTFDKGTRTFNLLFDGGTNKDPMDMLDLRSAFYELNKYNVEYNEKTGKYKVIELTEERADNEYSDFQKEFVSYGIMNFGLRFGISNYSLILPEDMYEHPDRVFNNLMDKFIGEDAQGEFRKIMDDFAVQFILNNADKVRGAFSIVGKPIETGKSTDDFGKTKKQYSGKTDNFFFDRSYKNEEGKEFPRFIVDKYTEDLIGRYPERTVFIRLNSATDGIVYYQRIDRESDVKHYQTSDEALRDGYKAEDHFTEKINGKPVFNLRVSDTTIDNFNHKRGLLQKGDIISLTMYHDPLRVNKVYKQVKDVIDDVVWLKDVKVIPEAKLHDTKETQTTSKKQVDRVSKLKQPYIAEKSIGSLLDSLIKRSGSFKFKRLVRLLKNKMIDQDLTMKFGELAPGDFGMYYPDGTFVMDINQILTRYPDITLAELDRMVYHELVHGVVTLYMQENADFAKKIQDIIEGTFELDTSGRIIITDQQYELIKKAYTKHGRTIKSREDIYGLKNMNEFVSELLSNAAFAEGVENIRASKEERNIFQKIIDEILSWFGINREQSPGMEQEFIDLILDTKYIPNLVRVGENTYINEKGEIYTYERVALESDEKTTTETDETKKKVLSLADEIKKNTEKAKIDMKADGNEGSFYSIENVTKKIKRVTDLVMYFSNKKIDPNVSFAQHMADMKWMSKPHDQKFENKETGVMEDYDTYLKRIETSVVNGQVKGKIMHLYLKRVANRMFNLGYEDESIIREINNIASLAGGAIDPRQFRWLENDINQQKIFHQAGINVFKDVPESMKDVVYLPEQTMWDERLGIGGTVDALIGKADGTWTIVDYKTGNNFGKKNSTQPLKYGLQSIYISDNQRERAKLQVMWYAFLTKLNHPDMKFSDLMVAWIPNEFMVGREDVERHVEVRPYMEMIKSFLNDKQALKDAGIDENIMDYILKKSPKIFDVSEYTNHTEESLLEEIGSATYHPETTYQKKVFEIQAILNRFKGDIEGGRQIMLNELSDWKKNRLKDLYAEIAAMKADPSMQLDVAKDIPAPLVWVGNYSDINIGVFQNWSKMFYEGRDTYIQLHRGQTIQVQELLRPIYEKYMKGKFRIKRGGIDRIANVNYAELFAFAFKEEEHKGIMRERLLVETDKEWKGLSEDQQKFLKHLNNVFASWFIGPNALMNQVATRMKGVDYTWLELLNTGRETGEKIAYYPGWFPKTMKTMEEVNYEAGVEMMREQIGKGDVIGANLLGRFSKKVLKERALRSLTWFKEETWEGWDDKKMSLPVKYMDTFALLNSRNYSHNLMFAFDNFNKSMLHKKYMDPVFSVGQALKVYLQLKTYGNGQPMYENTISFLEKILVKNVQGRMLRPQLLSMPLTIGKYYDPYEGKMKIFNLNIDKVVESLTNWTSMTTMWLKPMQGIGNGLHASSLVAREALKGGLAGSLFGVDGDLIDITPKDFVFAYNKYFTEFEKNAMFGNLNKDKAYLLYNKLDYIPDNYDYATNKRFLLSTRNSAISQSTMYVFHSKFEEFVSLTTMIAQLHRLKNKVTGKSLWDSYEVQQMEDGRYDVVWVGGTRGYEKIGTGITTEFRKMTGLTSHEIAKLKKVHERMQGGYRKEEAANLELLVMGRTFIQFKKYFPRLIMNALGSQKEVMELGYYKKLYETHKDPDTGEDLPAYEWVRRINEGRWRTLLGTVAAYLRLGDRGYRWESLKPEQKQNLIDAFLTFGMWIMSYSAYLAFFGDEPDDDTYKKWWEYYLIENMTQQYNPLDLLHTMESIGRPVALARMYKLTESMTAMLFATGNLAFGEDPDKSFTSAGQLKGWNELMRSIPYIASYHDFVNKMKKGSISKDWWGERFENSWR